MHTTNTYNKGSSLMAVIIVTVVSITVIGAITIMTTLILYSMSGWQQSLNAQAVAESLADDYLLRLIRDPQITPVPGEHIQLNNATGYVTLTPAQTTGQPNVLNIRGVAGDYVRKIKILYIIEDGYPHILSRQETP